MRMGTVRSPLAYTEFDQDLHTLQSSNFAPVNTRQETEQSTFAVATASAAAESRGSSSPGAREGTCSPASPEEEMSPSEDAPDLLIRWLRSPARLEHGWSGVNSGGRDRAWGTPRHSNLQHHSARLWIKDKDPKLRSKPGSRAPPVAGEIPRKVCSLLPNYKALGNPRSPPSGSTSQTQHGGPSRRKQPLINKGFTPSPSFPF